MAKVYDPIMCMMVEQRTNDVQVKLYSVSYKSDGVYQTIGVHAENETHAKEKARRYFECRGKEAEIIGASIGESYATMKAKGKPILDACSVDAPPWGSRYDSIMRSLDNVERHYNEAKKNLMSDLNSIYKNIGEFDSKYGDAASTNYLSKRHAEVMRLVSSMR